MLRTSQPLLPGAQPCHLPSLQGMLTSCRLCQRACRLNVAAAAAQYAGDVSICYGAEQSLGAILPFGHQVHGGSHAAASSTGHCAEGLLFPEYASRWDALHAARPRQLSSSRAGAAQRWHTHATHGGAVQRPPHSRESVLSSIEEVDMTFTREDERAQDHSAPQRKEYERAKTVAAGYLARRPHSRKELETKLHNKGHDAPIVQDVLDRLHELGMQSDSDFAEVYARSKWRQSRWAPSRIRMELVKRGVAKADIEHALHHVFGDHVRAIKLTPDSDDADAGQHGGIDQELWLSAHRHAHQSRGLPIATRRRRMVGWLQRRGHSWDTISQLLQRLNLYTNRA